MAKNLTGRCPCSSVTYSLSSPPMIVHCCHCTYCQRETGTCFAVNAVIEASRVTVSGAVETIVNPSFSGNGHKIARCKKCKSAVWSWYHQAGPEVYFVLVGTLDRPHDVKPDVHIYAGSKVDWVEIPEGVKRVRGVLRDGGCLE